MTTTSKKAFVLSHPESTSADDIVATAKEAGFELNKKYVHTIRSLARTAKKKKRKATKVKATHALAAHVARVKAPKALKHDIDDATLIRALAQRGLTHSEHLMAQLKEKFDEFARVS